MAGALLVRLLPGRGRLHGRPGPARWPSLALAGLAPYASSARLSLRPGEALALALPASCRPLDVHVRTTPAKDHEEQEAVVDVPDGCALERDGNRVVLSRQGEHGTRKIMRVTLPERYVGVDIDTHAGSVEFTGGSIKEAPVSVHAPAGSIVAWKGASVHASRLVLCAGDLPGVDFSHGTLAATPLRVESTNGGSVFAKKVVSGDAIVAASKGPGAVRIETLFARAAVVSADSGAVVVKAGRYGASLAGTDLAGVSEEAAGASAAGFAEAKWRDYSLLGEPPQLEDDGGLLAIVKGGTVHLGAVEGCAAAVRAGSPGLVGFGFPAFRSGNVHASATTECTRLLAMNRGAGDVFLDLPPADGPAERGGRSAHAGCEEGGAWDVELLSARGVRYSSDRVAEGFKWCGVPRDDSGSEPLKGPRWIKPRQRFDKSTTYPAASAATVKAEAERGMLVIGEYVWKPPWET